jgi:hypothetical protein
MPHEGSTELDTKQHYFYHSRLHKFGSDASRDEEDPVKFLCVTKAPTNAHNKKVFYVYGKGWNSTDRERIRPTQTVEEGKDFAWPTTKQPHDVVYSLSIVGSSKIL